MLAPTARRALAVGLLAAGLLGPASSAAWGTASGPAWSRPAAAVDGGADFRLLDPRITESSGLALSRRHPHTVWTTNDSGDGARLFAVDTRTGRTTGVHAYGAPVTDVEALAITPQGRVLVGDLGDNAASRRVVRVFWFDEPGLGETSGGWGSWELAYPDGPHDAESLAVDPRSGRVYVVTKGSTGGVYALPRRPSRQGVNRLVRVAPAPAVATDAAFLADGSALVVRTYTQAVRLDPATFDPVGSAFLPLQRQGETVALAPGGDGLLVGSEGAGSTVRLVDVPAAASPASRDTTASPTTSPATTPPGAAATTDPTTGSSPPPSAPATDSASPPVSTRQVVAGASASVGLVAIALLATWLARRAAHGGR